MRSPSSTLLASAAVTLCALAFMLWVHAGRVRHIEHVSGIGEASPRVDASSATGLAGETRALIVPGHHRESYEWITQTQQMLTQGEARIRWIDHENAPEGRAVFSASPYRWWLGFLAWMDHAVSGRPAGLSVERAALYGDPLLHVLFFLAVTAFAAWHFGALSAVAVALGGACVFPFAAGFLAGAPDDAGFAVLAAGWNVLLLLPGVRALHSAGAAVDATSTEKKKARRWFIAAGIVGGGAAWIDVATQVPVIVGIAIGALAATWSARADAASAVQRRLAASLWRIWSLSAAAAMLVGYLIEFFPSHLDAWALSAVHPVYGVAWLGLGELVAQGIEGAWLERKARKPREIVRLSLALIAIASVPTAMWLTKSTGFLPVDSGVYQLSRLPDGVAARNLWDWLVRAQLDSQLLATVAPVLLLVVAGWWAFLRRINVVDRSLLAFALGPCVVVLSFATVYLQRWHLFDALVLMLIAVSGAIIVRFEFGRARRGAWFVALLLVLLPGVWRLWPRDEAAQNAAPLLEVEGLVERDLARWLAKRIGPRHDAVVWAPPDVTNTLYFYGGLRGVGTFSPQNQQGLAASFQLARATTHEEALALVRRRRITHIVLPSWAPFFEEASTSATEGQPIGFLAGIREWMLPAWLRPVPYQFAPIAGIEGYAVTIFEVVDEQEPAVALSRVAEYFAEMGDLVSAAWAEESLRRFPADLSALTARAQVMTARSDAPGAVRVMETSKIRLRSRADRFLAWDRRVSLAIVLARDQNIDLARAQTQRCLDEIAEDKLRALSPGMLFNFQLLCIALDLQIEDVRLRELARELLPPELREHLERR